MRVLFLVPPLTNIINRDFASTHLTPSLGIASMIGNIQAGFPDISTIDAFAERLSLAATVARIKAFAPDVVGVSSITTQIHDAAITASAVKKVLPAVKFVVGGPHTSKIPEQTLREFPSIDFAAAGEGEGIILDLLTALRDGKSTDNIPGLYSLRDGQAVSGGVRPFIEDLDSLPFPEWKHVNWDACRAIFDLRTGETREVSVSLNRGCPFNCIFCAKFLGNRVRKRSITGVVEEIQRDIDKYGARRILFTDETFTIDRARTVEFCELLIKKRIDQQARWICITRPDKLDDEVVALLKRAGCDGVCMGADSVSDEVLKQMNKNAHADDTCRAIAICAKHGILTEASYIIGMPEDTAASANRMIAGAIAADSDFATFSILVPYPGTKIMEMAQKSEQGLKLLSRDWRNYGKQLGYAMETANLDRAALEKLQRKAYYRFYLRPRKIKNAFKMADPKVVLLYAVAHALRRIGLGPKRS